MWGEFEEDEIKTTPSIASRGPGGTTKEKPSSSTQTQTTGTGSCNQKKEAANDECIYDKDGIPIPLRDRLLHHLAASDVTVKSQQRYEPDLTYMERLDILSKLLQDKPGQFLYRFGRSMSRDDLQYFLQYEGDPEVDHYLSQALQHHNPHTARIKVRNRRYAALERLRREGDYFSEKEMERRHPLLYDQLVACHQTDQERQSQYPVNRADLSLSTILLEHIDLRANKELKQQQKEAEDDMLEEEEDSEEEEEEEEEEQELAEDRHTATEGEEKRLYKEEFCSSSYNEFLTGGHEDFDYRQIDASDDYDLLDIQARDAEESYFDHDSDDTPPPSTATTDEQDTPDQVNMGSNSKTENKLARCVNEVEGRNISSDTVESCTGSMGNCAIGIEEKNYNTSASIESCKMGASENKNAIIDCEPSLEAENKNVAMDCEANSLLDSGQENECEKTEDKLLENGDNAKESSTNDEVMEMN